MLVPPVAQGGTGDRPVGDAGGRAQQSSGPAGTATLWPLAPAQPNQVPNQQSQGIPPLAATPAPAHNQGVSRYGLYSLFPGGGGGSYVAATPATPGPPTPARAYHATTHKVSESVFSAAVGVGVGGYTWGAPTPPPGSPYSPVPVTQLELLAKNLASLAPPGQQALSLQGVGVNVGSLHHAQHTQHTQHTLNLAGLHHLHHEGLHQNTFSPQLSLVTGNAPTLTINSFSPNSTGNVVPTTGVLLQEYQSPTGSTATGCSVAVNGSSCPTSSTSSTMVIQGGNQVVQTTAKKREAFLSSQGQPVKLENKSTRQPCVCRNSNGKTKVVHSDAGCSRTLPVASSWNGQDANNGVNSNTNNNSLVKREPLASVPCQVAEVSTSLHATTTSVKIEPVPPKSENGIVVSNANAGGIPVGIAMARQRSQHQETSASMRNVSLSHHTSHHASYHHFQPDNLGSSSTAMTVGGATLVHCGGGGGEERPAHLAIPSGALAPSLNAALGSSLGPNLGPSLGSGLNSTLNSSLNSTLGSTATAAATTAWPPTLWQYPASAAAAAAAAAAATAAMPMEPVGFPQMGVGVQGGLQLVRDPSSGHLLLIHAAEQMQQAVVWPNYPNHNGGNVAPPSLLLPPPPPSLQLLSDIGGARLVLTESKRKQQSTLPIVKIEADCGTSPTTIITSTESTKALQSVTSVTGTLVPDAPLVTTLHYYPHAPALVQISQTEPTHCRSQQRNAFISKATSPVSCLTPPPEVTTIHAIEPPQMTPMVGVQDASNQTEAPEAEQEQDMPMETQVKQEQNLSPCQLQCASTATNLTTTTTTTTTNLTNLTNFEIVAATPEKMCNVVRITTTTTTVNPTVCGIVGKVDKAENTIINMADCPKYSITRECRSVTSIDRTIERVVSRQDDLEQDEEEDSRHGRSMINDDDDCYDNGRSPICRDARTGPRIIEITEENCDSFHENLEFFGTRRDRSTDRLRDRRRSYAIDNMQEQHQNREEEKKIIVEEPMIDRIAEESRGTVIHQVIAKLSPETSCCESQRKEEMYPESKVIVDSTSNNGPQSMTTTTTTTTTTSSQNIPDCESCGKNRDVRPQMVVQQNPEVKPQISVKSFDMPNIDCDDQELETVVIKQEADDGSFDEQNSKFENVSTIEKPKDSMKRHSVERSHPGIENVVEKLKKNAAAAMQESSCPLQKIDESKERNLDNSRSRRHSETMPRKLENGLKKHILRSCENEKLLNEKRENIERSEIEGSSEKDSSSLAYSREYLHNDNNNDSRSNNNNIKNINDKEYVIRKRLAVACESKVKDDVSEVNASPPKKSRLDRASNANDDTVFLSATIVDNQSTKLKLAISTKQKSNVDLSGLELLSNSIEQFEHLKPEAQNCSTPDLEKSPSRGKLISPQGESNNNNVDSPLGLLCALAEQRFMEEVGDKVPRKLNLESSEEISRAGRLLLNLGRTSLEKERKRLDKRKSTDGDDENYEKSKRLKADVVYETTEDGKNSSIRYYEKCGKSRRHGARFQEDMVFRVKEKPNRSIDLAEENGIDDEETSSLAERFVRERERVQKFDKENNDLDYDRKKETLERYDQQYDRFCGNDRCYRDVSKEDALTDSETENDKTVCSTTRLEEEVDVNTQRRQESTEERNRQVKLDAKTNVGKKLHTEEDGDWPNMDAMELDMRVRLADIQRQYREKQKELSRLTPKKEDKRSPGRPRKKSHSSSSEHGTLSSPPILEPAVPCQKSPSHSPDGAPPPLTSAVLAMPRCNVNLVKLGEPRSHIKLLDSIPSIPIPVPPVASPITVLPTSKIQSEDDDKSTGRMEYDTSSPAPTVASSSSASKKRKVGRPRKLMCTSGNTRHFTETIVAKKPKSKSSLVGYLLSPKNRHLQTKYIAKSGYTPLPFKTGMLSLKASSKNHKSVKAKMKPAKQTPLHNKNVISSIIAEKAKLSHEVKLDKHSNKVRPKLKAEAKVKTWEDDESTVVENISSDTMSQEILEEKNVEQPEEEEGEEEVEREMERNKHDKTKKKKQKSISSSPSRHKSSDRDKKESKRRKSSDCKDCKECAKVAKAERTESIINRCKLTSAHLAIDQLRVLTAMGGLFYAGRLSAVQAPDVYAITLDGERGNRPHIHSREEILRDAIVEVCPSSTKELPPGTRLCAYWSEQYRCLYPGTSVEPTEPDPELDEKFVSVEFDDGDSGRIALDDIRLLQPDYPVVEYDPNPLLSLGKRRRQTSVSIEDKRSSINTISGTTSNSLTSTVSSTTSSHISSFDGASIERHKTDDISAKALDDYRERKRLKKRRKDKLKRQHEAQEGKKKHKRHKGCEEHRKHKHRKHRKHKHKHSHHCNHSEGSHISSGESCCGQKSEDEPNKETPAKVEEEEEEEEDEEEEEEESEEMTVLEEEPEPVPEPIEVIVREEKIEKPKKSDKKGKVRERQESVESRSKMAAFLPARQLWGWAGRGYRRPGAKGRAKKQFFRAIQRGNETIQIGDSAVFLSTGRPDRPYIGRIESMWETSSSNMIVKVKWFYHPEETVGCPTNLKYPGALFESPHMDENDVQTISHKCEVLPLDEYTEKLGKEPHRYLTIYDNNDIYYLAGYYDPTTYLLSMQPGVV